MIWFVFYSLCMTFKYSGVLGVVASSSGKEAVEDEGSVLL
jgi:hypothetical protein